jgi:MFS family permease
MHIDRHIAIWGYLGGAGFALAMMVAPEYLHLDHGLAAALFWGGFGLFVVATVVIIILAASASWKRSWITRIFLLAIPLVVILCALHFSPLGWLDLGEDTLPGFSSTALMKVENLAVTRRQYVFQFSTPEGARSSLYFSRNDLFVFSAEDVYGESHDLELSIGSKGIPLNRLIFLSCEIGITSNSTFIQVLINGKEIKKMTIPYRVDFGSRDWASRGTFGADNNGQNGSGWFVAAMSVGHVTLTNNQYEAIIRGICKYLKDIKSPLIAEKPASFLERIFGIFIDLSNSPCHGQ